MNFYELKNGYSKWYPVIEIINNSKKISYMSIDI
jgi:hypothetical protein